MGIQRKAFALSSFVFFGFAVLVSVMIGIIGYFIVSRDEDRFREEAERLRMEYVDQKKAQIRGEVEKVVDYIQYQWQQRRKRLQESIEARTKEAIGIAESIYARKHGIEPEAKVRKDALDVLRAIRFDDGRGYYFGTRLDGVEILFADRPEMEGKNLLAMQDTRGAYVIRDMIDLVKREGGGFYEYTWTKPNEEGRDFPKIAYVERFEPFDGFIGTGEYIDDVERDIQREVLERIEKIRFGEDGYIFVVNYQGVTLMNGLQPQFIGKDMWEMTDPYGLKVIQMERKAVENPHGDFIYYHWEKPTTKQIAPKASFLKGFPQWEWMVGAGVYLDDVDLRIAGMEAEARLNARNDLLLLGWVLAGVLLAALAFSYAVSRFLRLEFDVFLAFFRKMETGGEPIETDRLLLREFRFLGNSANAMLQTRKAAEEEKNLLQEQLQQAMKMEAVGRLAGGMAHDFNNLLTSIIGNVELALMDLPPDHPLARDLGQINEAAHSAADLVRRLLAFSRKQVIEPKVTDLNKLIRSLHKMLKRLIGEDVELRTVEGQALGMVRVDPGQFEQVIVNLAVNARDAMPKGGNLVIETATVELDEAYCHRHSGVHPGEYVMLAVSDTGHGMSEEVKKHLFEPFFTTKSRERGTGLGLASIFGTVKQACGNIEVYSEENRGTTFKIYLPRAEEEREKPCSSPLPEEMPRGGETILLVEDERMVRELTTKILKQLGYDVLCAADGDEAIRTAEAHRGPIELLMTDVVMPGMNGRQLAGRLAKIRPEMKVLYASGYTENVIAHHGVVEETVNFLGKPYSIPALSKKIREVLSAKKK
ncbi:MAG: response regulator [Myxococcales bacterium]|nr:MAG: response regulator [Myxococcales bacterium]